MEGKDLNRDSAPDAPEFSRTIKVSAIDSAPERIALKATPDECAALAARYDLISLEDFCVQASLARWRKGVRVEGRITGQAVQRSVVTLDPVSQSIDESFVRGFLPDIGAMPDVKPGAEIEMPVDAELDDSPELLSDRIDVGELAAEALGLALDPYPRAETEEYLDTVAGPPGEKAMTDEYTKPFASLAEYRKKLTGGEGSQG